VHSLGGGRLTLDYPPVDMLADLTSRPAHAGGGQVRAVTAARTVTVRRRHGRLFTVPAGATVPKGAARDRFGNRNGKAALVSVEPG
jgi:hypothetical protein